MVPATGKPVYLLQTPDGSEGKSTLPTLDMPAGYEGAVIVSVVIVNHSMVALYVNTLLLFLMLPASRLA
jgi:hypothetical protein